MAATVTWLLTKLRSACLVGWLICLFVELFLADLFVCVLVSLFAASWVDARRPPANQETRQKTSINELLRE
jgi:hypothetical protein